MKTHWLRYWTFSSERIQMISLAVKAVVITDKSNQLWLIICNVQATYFRETASRQRKSPILITDVWTKPICIHWLARLTGNNNDIVYQWLRSEFRHVKGLVCGFRIPTLTQLSSSDQMSVRCWFKANQTDPIKSSTYPHTDTSQWHQIIFTRSARMGLCLMVKCTQPPAGLTN